MATLTVATKRVCPKCQTPYLYGLTLCIERECPWGADNLERWAGDEAQPTPQDANWDSYLRWADANGDTFHEMMRYER